MRLGSVRGEMYFLCMDVEQEQVALSNLYFSLSAALKVGKRGKTWRKGVRPVGGYQID